MNLIKWTSHSLTQLVKALSQQGHRIKRTALADLLHEQGSCLKVNKKTMEGTSPADRDEQFGHITALCQQFEQKQAPAISVDCKKKELLGTFKNQGTTTARLPMAKPSRMGSMIWSTTRVS